MLTVCVEAAFNSLHDVNKYTSADIQLQPYIIYFNPVLVLS